MLVCYNLSLMRIRGLHIRMIPIMEKFLCISWANARPRKQNQLDNSQHRGVGLLMWLYTSELMASQKPQCFIGRSWVSPHPYKGVTLWRYPTFLSFVWKVNLSLLPPTAQFDWIARMCYTCSIGFKWTVVDLWKEVKTFTFMWTITV